MPPWGLRQVQRIGCALNDARSRANHANCGKSRSIAWRSPLPSSGPEGRDGLAFAVDVEIEVLVGIVAGHRTLPVSSPALCFATAAGESGKTDQSSGSEDMAGRARNSSDPEEGGELRSADPEEGGEIAARRKTAVDAGFM